MPISNGQINNGSNGGGGGGGNINYTYKGVYDASNNIPPLANGTGTVGWWYLTTVEGNNNPTGQLLKVNQIIAYNGTIWQAGGQIDNSDEIIVAPDYIVVRGQTIQVGQSLTLALGILEGQIADLSQNIANALNGKIDKVPGATVGDIPTFKSDGGVEDSGVKLSSVTQQLNTNTQNISSLTQTVNQQGQNIAGLSQTVNQQGQQISTLQTDVQQQTQDIAKNTQDIAKNTQDIAGINQTLNSKQNTVPSAANGNLAEFSNGSTIDSGIAKDAVATKQYVDQNTVKSISKDTTANGDIIFKGAGVIQNGNEFTFPAAGDGTVTKVSSSNTDIAVTNETTTPVLTLNSTVDGGGANAGKVIKLDENGNMGNINVGLNTQALNPKTLQLTTLNQALQDAYGSMPNIAIANTAFVGKNGSAQGTGAINNLYPTIQAAIDASPANTQIYVYASGLATATAYTENLTLKANQVITGASSQFVVIAGTVTTPATGGTCYIENVRIQPPSNAGNVNPINFAGGANVTNLQLSNVDVNLYGGTGSCVNWTNTNANSRLLTDGTSAWNVIVSSAGAKLFTSAVGTAGQAFLQNVSAQINDNINNVAYSIGGAVRVFHTLDNIYGQIRVADTATFTGTFLTIYTGNVAAMVTNSTGVSSFNNVGMTTTANATANTALVEGAGGFAYFNTAAVNTTTKGFATTLNGGVGAIAIPIYAMRLDSSGIAPFTAGTSDGLIQYDGNNYFVDTLLARYKIVTADNTTNKILGSWLPNGENSNSVDIPLSASLLPLNGIRVLTNSSTTATINISLPTNYVYTSTAYGNSTTSLALPPKASVSLMCTAINTAPVNSTVAIVGFALASGGTPYTLPVATATVLGGVKVGANSGINIDAQGNITPNYNQTPTFVNKSANDVMSSASLWNALPEIVGNNLNYDPVAGKINAVTSPASGGTYAIADDYLLGQFLSISGGINFNQALNKTTNGCTISDSGITLLPNRTYLFNMMLPVKTAGAPDLNLFDLKYTGSATNPPTYPLDTNTMNVVNGTIANNVFTASAINAQVQSKGYAITGALTQYTPKATIYPTQGTIGTVSTTPTQWSFYTRIGVPDTVLYKSGNSINFLTGATKASFGSADLGTTTSLWIPFTNPVAPSGTYFDGGGVVNDKYSVLFFNGNQTSVYFQAFGSGSWTATPAQATQVNCGRSSSGISANMFLTFATNKTGYRFNLDNNSAVALTLPNENTTVFLRGVANGYIGANIGFAIANNAATTWDTIYTLANNSTTINSVVTNIKTVVPQATQMGGIVYNQMDQYWYCIVWDYDNNNSYFLRSNAPRDVTNWGLIQTINGTLYGNLAYANTRGVNLNGYMMVATKVSKSGVEANTTVCSVNGGQFNTISNDLTLRGVIPVPHPSGVMTLSSGESTQSYKFSYDGITWENGTAFSNMQGYLVPTLLGFTRIAANYSWQYITSAVYTIIYNVPLNLIPDAIWLGGQYLTSVFGSSAQHQITSYVANGNGMDVSTNSIPIAGNNTITNIQIGVAGFNPAEQTTNVYASMLTLVNSVRLTASSSVGSEITTTPQYAIAQNDRIPLSGLIVTGSSAATLSVNYDFAINPVQILAGATMNVTEV